MAKCKINGCGEQHVYNRRWGHKRYCETHGNLYADKRDKAQAVRAKMPDCESGISPSCIHKVSLRDLERGKNICHFCEEYEEEARQRKKYERQKYDEFQSANSVEQLKTWMMEYML